MPTTTPMQPTCLEARRQWLRGHIGSRAAYGILSIAGAWPNTLTYASAGRWRWSQGLATSIRKSSIGPPVCLRSDRDFWVVARTHRPISAKAHARTRSKLAFAGLGGCRIALFDEFLDARAAVGRGQRAVRLDASGLCGEILILDGLTKPARIGAPAQVMQPGAIIDAGGQLQERAEVV